MCVELGKFIIPCSNLFDVRINLSLKDIQLHIGGIMLQTLSLVAQVDGTLQTPGASGEYIRIGMFESLFHLLLIFVKEILVTKA